MIALRQRSPVVVDVPDSTRFLLLQRYFEMSIRISRLTTLSFAVFLLGMAYEAPLVPRLLALVAMGLAMHLRAGRALRARERLDPSAPRSDTLHDALMVATALSWSAAPYLLQGHVSDVGLQGVLYGALIPIAVTAIGYIAALPACAVALVAGAVPLTVFMLLQQTPVLVVMGIGTVMCVATLLARAATGHGLVLQALAAEQENVALVQELRIYREALETENANLGSSLLAAARAASSDPLTGLFNRRHIHAFANQLAHRVASGEEDLTLCMIDVDHFKQVNDRHGHPVGDEVLRSVGALLGARLRDGDCLARFGGEEFVAVLRHCDVNRGRRVAESLRHNVAASKIVTDAGEVPVTVSIGLAQWAQGEAFDDVLERADRALYNAKHSGRDRVGIDHADAVRLVGSGLDLLPAGPLH